MPMEARSNNALFKRAEQLKRWEESETNKVPVASPAQKIIKIQFSEGCVFLAACGAGDTEEVERLLSMNVDINTANVDGLTALHQACIDNNLDMVQFLVEHKCDVNRGDNEGWTPLHATASCGFISIAKYLIDNGANVAAVNNDGDLPIDITESTEMEEYLSDVLDEQGIDCEEARSLEEKLMLEGIEQMRVTQRFQDSVHPRTGASALHVAAAKGYMGVLRYLVQAGADLNGQDNDGWTALHAAAHWGQKDACIVLADNLANMDIQNLAGQTCFDVADPELVKLLEELKKKQTSLQEDKPEIQAILQRTSQRAPLKRRTSVTRMSGQEKSKSVMKDTKAERAQIENLVLPEDEETVVLTETSKKLEPAAPTHVIMKPVDVVEPSWKKMLRRASETSENAIESSHPAAKSFSETEPVTLKRVWGVEELDVKKPTEYDVEMNKEVAKSFADAQVSNIRESSFIPPLRDDESELQRKAHAKRVRETRRSTQGVLLEDIKTAELQYLIKSQIDAAKRQAEESAQIKLAEETKTDKATLEDSTVRTRLRSTDEAKRHGEEILQEEYIKQDNKTPMEKSLSERSLDLTTARMRRRSGEADKKQQEMVTSKLKHLSLNTSETENEKNAPRLIENTNTYSAVHKSRSPSPPEDLKNSEGSSVGTQAAIQRRRRPKRRSTGVVFLENNDQKENKSAEKETTTDADSEVSERIRLRYGSSSLPDISSDFSASGDTTKLPICGSHSSVKKGESLNYKKLYDEIIKENERLKEALKNTEEELERTKKQVQKLSQNNAIKVNLNENEKKEKRSLERKLSEMEEEMKTLSKLKAENDKLKAENRALSRVVCKLSK